MKKRMKNSLFLQLGVLTGTIMLVLVGAFVITNQYVRRSLRDSTLEMNNKIMLQVEGKIEEFQNSVNHVATTLVYSPTIYNYFAEDLVNRVISSEDVSSVFFNTLLLEEDISDIYLYDADMMQIAGIGKFSEEMENLEFLRAAKTKMEFSDIFWLGQRNTPYYAVYFPVFDLGSPQYGQRIGMCVFIMRTEALNTFLEDSQATEHTEVYITDANGNVAAKNGNGEIAQFGQTLMKSDGQYYVQIQETGIDGWRIISRIPKGELDTGAGHFSGVVTILYTVAVSLMVLLIYFCYRRLVMPMRAVNLFIKEAVAKPEKRMQTEREDEIGTVVKSLNQMLDEKEEMSLKVQESQKKMYETELAKKQLQILAYQNQINPHFLYNTLDCIRAMALCYEADGIAEIVMALSKVFRFAVKGEHIVTVEEEVDYIKEYAKIIDYRFMGKIEVNIRMEEEVREKRVIKLLLQPLVENAVFHGLEQRVEDGAVEVNIGRKDEGHLMFKVTDNGCGIEEEKLKEICDALGSKESKNGIGMSNIYQRLKLFYGEAVEFDVQSKRNQGTVITIVVPDDVWEDKEKNV